MSVHGSQLFAPPETLAAWQKAVDEDKPATAATMLLNARETMTMDVFALGIMLGYLLVGYLHVKPNDDDDVARQLKFDQQGSDGGGGCGCCGGGGGDDISEPRLLRDPSEVNEDAADLWRRMTLPEAGDRIDVAQALRHQWFAPKDEVEPPLTTATAPSPAAAEPSSMSMTV